MDPDRLYRAVRQGFPVVVWMPYSLEVRGRGFWMAPADTRIDCVTTGHAVVLAGVDRDGVYYADLMKPALQRASFPAFEPALAQLGSHAVGCGPEK